VNLGQQNTFKYTLKGYNKFRTKDENTAIRRYHSSLLMCELKFKRRGHVDEGHTYKLNVRIFLL